MNKIEKLQAELKATQSNEHEIIEQLQVEYNKLFDADKDIQKAIADLEKSVDYYDEYDGIYSYIHYYPKNVKRDEKEYLKNYFRDAHCLDYNPERDTLACYHGDDNLIIQDDSRHRRDNGVWQGHKQVIDESEYRDEDTGEIDESKRNKLIEAHMEKTGYFPGVFRVDQHGNVFPVKTN